MLTERLGDKALSGTGEAGNQQRLMGCDPTVLRQLQQLIFAQAAGGFVVEPLDGGGAVFELLNLATRSRAESLRFSRESHSSSTSRPMNSALLRL